jgi:hypothetical protein
MNIGLDGRHVEEKDAHPDSMKIYREEVSKTL